MKKVRSLIITGFGINCEEEMASAYQLAGADAEIHHLNDIFGGRINIQDYFILNFPGGFAFGDDLGSGKVLSNKMKFKKMSNGNSFFAEIRKFLRDGKFILGICNGFQFLVKMGLLPNISGKWQQEVTLTRNDSGKFEDRWIHCKVNSQNRTPFLDGIDVLPLPVRHGEGKFIVKNEKIKNEILKKKLNCLSYCDAKGNIVAEYPLNPNGAELNCAGLTDKTGQIFGLMPHPEAFLSLYNHPDWARLKRVFPQISEKGAGLKIFNNIVEHIMRNN